VTLIVRGPVLGWEPLPPASTPLACADCQKLPITSFDFKYKFTFSSTLFLLSAESASLGFSKSSLMAIRNSITRWMLS